MKKSLIIISLLIITGCDDAKQPSLEGLKCSKSELEQASAQFELCNKSGFFSSYCLESAMRAHCSIKTMDDSK